MATIWAVLSKLYLPLALSLLCLILLFLVTNGNERVLMTVRPFGDFVDLRLEISNVFVIKALLLAMIPCFVSSYLFYDYTTFFPKRLQMEVFYDNAGIRQSLSVFSKDELERLRIPSDYRTYQAHYFENIDAELRKMFGVSQFFSIKEGTVHSTGNTETVGDKIRGWQKYHVTKSEGELTHILEVPNLPPKQFYIRFEKLPSGDDYINLSIKDLFIRQRVTLRSEFKQILLESRMGEGVRFKLSVVGVTQVKVFPWPGISNTVYLAKLEDVGLIPIAYAVYR